MFLLLLAFAHAGYVAFNHKLVQEFGSFQMSLMTSFRLIFSDVNPTFYERMRTSQYFFGPVYYVLFKLLMLLVFSQVFLAIVVHSFHINA